MTHSKKLALTSLLLLPLWGCTSTGVTNMPPQASPPAINRTSKVRPTQNLQDGQYPLQQASFDDGSGAYTLMLLNTPAGMPSTVQLNNVKMARLTDEQVKSGEKSYVKVANGEPTLYLTEDFKIAYTHNVTEVQTNPNTGQRETVIVRRESSFWSPFLGAVAGQAIGSMLFRPQYYVPPVYQAGGLFGYGGSGPSYRGAVSQYRRRYNRPPIVERNRTKFRSTGQLSNGRVRARTARTRGRDTFNQKRSTGSGFGSSTNQKRSTGSGFGSSTLKRDRRRYNRQSTPRKRRSGFGSSNRRSRSGGFGRRRRR